MDRKLLEKMCEKEDKVEKEIETSNSDVVINKETKEIWPDSSCKKCYGRGWIKITVSSKTPLKKELLKKAEEGQTPTFIRCSCLGKGNQERAKKNYLKLMGNEHEKGFKIKTSEQSGRDQQTEPPSQEENNQR